MLENPATQVFVDFAHDKLGQTPQRFHSLAKRWPVLAHHPMQYRFLGTATLVMVNLGVSRMTFGRVHPRALCACRAKRICSRFLDGFT